MPERLAIPAWSTPALPLSAWADAFTERGYPAAIEAETSEDAQLRIPTLGLKAFATIENGQAVALDFTFVGDLNALPTLDAVASALGWELYDESDDDD